MWVYIRSEPYLYTVGFYDPEGGWHTDSDHENKQKAANRVAFLNGSPDIALRQQRDELAAACKDLIIEVEDSVFPNAVHSTVWAVLNDDIKPLLASIEEEADA